MSNSHSGIEPTQPQTDAPPKRPSIWRMLAWGITDFIFMFLFLHVGVMLFFIALGIGGLGGIIVLAILCFCFIWMLVRSIKPVTSKTETARAIVRGIAVSVAIVLFIYEWAILVDATKAQKLTCASNQKQIALAFLMYAEDWNETLPPADHWAQAISSYIKNDDLLNCPQDPLRKPISYGMNAFLSGKKLGDIANPSEVVVVFETDKPGLSPSGGSLDVVIPPRHKDGNWYGFLDGHVKWYREIPAFVPTLNSPSRKK